MIHVSPPMIHDLLRVLDHRCADMIGVHCARPAPRLEGDLRDPIASEHVRWRAMKVADIVSINYTYHARE